MFNRRFIREKVIQYLYAFYQGGPKDGLVCEKEMLRDLRKTYEMFIYHLSLLVALSDYFLARSESGKKKFIPSEADLNPNTHFPHNRLIQQLRECPRFLVPNEACKFSWAQYESLLKSLYDEIIESNLYKEYISQADTFENDKNFLKKLYQKKIEHNPVFHSLCEDNSLSWAANYESVSYWIYSSIKKAEEGSDSWIPNDFLRDGNDESSDIVFGKKLLELTLLNGKEYEKFVFENLENWDPERLAFVDTIILKTGISELLNFPSIPVNVTLNEYIEVTKRFCSEKSRIFVNGLLNRVTQILKEKDLIKKSGRGLI